MNDLKMDNDKRKEGKGGKGAKEDEEDYEDEEFEKEFQDIVNKQKQQNKSTAAVS